MPLESQVLRHIVQLWVWWKWEILCLERELNPHLWHSGPHRLPDVTTIPTPTCLCSSLPERSVQPTTLIPHKPFKTYNYIQAVTSHSYIQGRFNNHRVHSLYRIMVMEPVTWVWWKWEIFCLERIEPTSLAFRASVLTIPPCRHPDVTSLPVYAAPDLRGQCSLSITKEPFAIHTTLQDAFADRFFWILTSHKVALLYY